MKHSNEKNSFYAKVLSVYPEQVDKYWSNLESDIQFYKDSKYVFNNPWDMECCKRPCYYKNNKVSPNGDPEWIFQYCRFEWLVKYLLVYEKSHDVTLLTQWAETICEFYEKNDCKRDSLYARAYPSKGIFKKILWRVERSLLGTRSPTYRSLDVAIRNAAILLALQHCVEIYDVPQTVSIKARVVEDSLYAYGCIGEFEKNSNWGIIIVCSYLLCGLFTSDDRINIGGAFETLKEMLKKQILPLGAHKESSSMYHNQVLLWLTKVSYWFKKLSRQYPLFIDEYIKLMYNYTKSTTGPDLKQVALGDSDFTSLNTLRAIVESVLKHDNIIKVIKEPDFILLHDYDFDFEKEELGELLNSGCVSDGVCKFVKDHFTLIVTNSYYGSSHKHCDNGSFSLYYGKVPILIDSGRYTYHDSYWREYFKGQFAHNIVSTLRDIQNIDEYNKNITGAQIDYDQEYGNVVIKYRTDNCEYQRIFNIKDCELYITDLIQTDNTIDTVYQNLVLHPSFKQIGNNIFSNEELSIELSNDYLNTIVTDGWISTDYNYKEETIRIFSSSTNKTKYSTFIKILKVHSNE